MEQHKTFFKPRARLLLELGDQLIKSEKIALIELVKNSYDADSNNVTIKFEGNDTVKVQEIEIIDDGTGMDIDIIKNVWLEPGTGYKKRLLDKNKFSEKYKRLPLGEKGIGRFGVHKLGNEIEIVTRMLDKKEVYFKINWVKFSEDLYIEDIPIELFERDPEVFTANTSGTVIKIKNLKTDWTKVKIMDFYREVNTLSSPFESSDSFKVHISSDIFRLEEGKDIKDWNSIKDMSLYRFKCVISGDKITKFQYNFTPFDNMRKLERYEVNENDPEISKILKMKTFKNREIDLKKYSIGEIRFEGYIFDREAEILKIGVDDKKGLKSYLDSNGGVYIYRDGIRIYDYGEKGNDWLNLDIKRVNMPSRRISNNIIIAAINLERESSKDLIEQTNREGFIHNEAYEEFIKAVSYALDIVHSYRNKDKSKVRELYSSMNYNEPVINKIEEALSIIKNLNIAESKKNELSTKLEYAKKEYKEVIEVLVDSANSGMAMNMIIHEVEKIIKELSEASSDKEKYNIIPHLVSNLESIIDANTKVIGKDKISENSLNNIIKRAFDIVNYRLKVHSIEVIKNYSEKSDIYVMTGKKMIAGCIVNIIDNSIFWLEYYEIKNKKIFLDILEDSEKYYTLIIADNGKGFNLTPEVMVKPFVSRKPEGMGLGLYIADTVIKNNLGMLVFPDYSEVHIPDEFRSGAIIGIKFLKGSK